MESGDCKTDGRDVDRGNDGVTKKEDLVTDDCVIFVCADVTVIDVGDKADVTDECVT